MPRGYFHLEVNISRCIHSRNYLN